MRGLKAFACLLAGLGPATLAALYAAGPASATDLVVTYDQSQLLRLPKPAREIIIGNPTIADVVVQGDTLLIVTGKTFGITNFIALDAERNIIQQARVIVQRDEGKVVNLHKAGKRQSYNCTPQCNPMVTVGDDQTYFDTISKTSQQKIKMSESPTADASEKQ
jgi:hypothetical protein